MGLQSKGSNKEVCECSIKRREKYISKKAKEIISKIPKGFTVAVEDESIFVHDALTRRKMWTMEGVLGLLVWGAQYLSSGVTALLNSTIPLWIAIIAALIFKVHLTKRMGFGLAAGFAGLVILINPNNTNINLIGIVSIILSSIFWAAGSLYSTRSHMPVSILVSAGMLMLAGGIMLTITSFAAGEFKDFKLFHISTTSLAAYFYLIFLCTAVGYAEFFWLLRVESASIANSFAYIVPVIAVFFGWAIFKEPISLQTLIATSIIMVGVALMVTNSSTNKHKSKLVQKK